jgi:hypothetical protein
VTKYDDPGRIEGVGVENLRGMSEYDQTQRSVEYGNMDRPNYIGEEYYSDEYHYWNFIIIDIAKNAWVRNVTALHFAYSLVGTQSGAKWITVQDCVSREPVSRRVSARRFTYRLSGQLTLVQRCASDKGRHSFMMGQPTSTGNVFLDSSATIPYSSSEAHEQWVTGVLYDNCPRVFDGAVLEEHQHRTSGREHGLLKLYRTISSSEAARRAELLLRPHRRQTRWCSTSRCRI